MADTNVQGSMCETLVEYHDWLFPKEEGELPGDISDLAALRQKVPNVPAAPESSAGPQAASGSMASPVRPRSSVMPTSARASVMSSARRVSSASADDDDDMYSSDDGDGDGSHNDNDDTDALVAGIMAEPEASTSRPPLAAKPPLPPAASTKPTRRQSTGSRPTSGGAPALPAKPKPKPLSRPTSGGVEEEKTAPAVPKRTRSRAQSSVVRRARTGRKEDSEETGTCVVRNPLTDAPLPAAPRHVPCRRAHQSRIHSKAPVGMALGSCGHQRIH